MIFRCLTHLSLCLFLPIPHSQPQSFRCHFDLAGAGLSPESLPLVSPSWLSSQPLGLCYHWAFFVSGNSWPPGHRPFLSSVVCGVVTAVFQLPRDLCQYPTAMVPPSSGTSPLLPCRHLFSYLAPEGCYFGPSDPFRF